MILLLKLFNKIYSVLWLVLSTPYLQEYTDQDHLHHKIQLLYKCCFRFSKRRAALQCVDRWCFSLFLFLKTYFSNNNHLSIAFCQLLLLLRFNLCLCRHHDILYRSLRNRLGRRDCIGSVQFILQICNCLLHYIRFIVIIIITFFLYILVIIYFFLF